MYGSIPAGVSVPLHSHPDDESFYIMYGVVQGLTEVNGDFRWVELSAGRFLHIPANVKHAWKNNGDVPAERLITTTSELGRFFREISRPVQAGEILPPPTPEELEHFERKAQQYNHWLASPRENEAHGIMILPGRKSQ